MSGELPWLRMLAMLSILASLFVVPALTLYADERRKGSAAEPDSEPA